MKNLKYLVCHSEVNGFTFNHAYQISEVNGRFITVLNDSLEKVTFDSVEGENDFKNYFYGKF